MKKDRILLRAGIGVCIYLAWLASSWMSFAQAFSTTTVQGTVYQANGQPGSGVVQVSWPAFATAGNQAVAAGRTEVTIGADGFLSVNLTANQGATPAGLYYTAVYHLSDGTTSTEYWVVPAAAQASLSQVRAQVMPAAQAVQAVSKSYVDQTISQLTQSLLTASGGSLSGPLYLNGDPAQPGQAATKHYVDTEFSQALPIGGGVLTGPLTGVQLGAVYQADQFAGADFGARVQACLNGLSTTYGGTCDARNFSGNLSMASSLTITTANATVELPCATIATASQIIIAPGTRNVTLHGCASRGASSSSGSQGGTVFLYSGSGPMLQVGDPAYGVDTLGFHIDNAVINTTASSSKTAQGVAAYRTQELDVESMYFLGNSNQTGMTLDGTGNYTGGTFKDDQFTGFGTAINGVGHQVANAATTDWLNASTFVRLHIDCPTSGASPINGTFGINLQQGDGNTFTGGDIEGCSTALHLGMNAQNNTLVGVRNENSGLQIVADAGSSYNNWITGGTMFTGQLVDNGTRNSFLDTFHRSFNGLNGDWYGSQQDATVTNHYRVGIGSGNERGLLNRYQTDYGYRWTTGLSDATAGQQFYQVLDELNNVYRLSIGQYNHGQSSSNNQTVINAAGTGAVVLNGSANAGTGGVIFGAGGGSGATVATINSAGNAQFNGSLQVSGPSTFTSSTTVKNQSDAEIDTFLWAGATANQKESFIYKDYMGASQWYMVKDASNNWALNSALGGLDSFKAYQSNNSGDTYINASNPSGVVRVNYETGAGAGFNIYGGNSGTLYAGFTGPTSIKLPGLAAGSGHNCVQIDNSGYLSNTGAACATVNSGTAGQIAYYGANGPVVGGISSVPLSAGGTGATSASAALTNLGAQAALGYAPLNPSNNLMDVANPPQALANLGAQPALGYMPANIASNLGDLTNKAAALGNLMPGTAVDQFGDVSHPSNLTVAGTINAESGITGTAGNFSSSLSASSLSATGTVAAGATVANGSSAASIGASGLAIGGQVPIVNPELSGAYGDFGSMTCTTQASNTNLTCAGVTFTSADVGKVIAIAGAGTFGYANWLTTTIAAYESGSQITLANPAINAVMSAYSVYGHDDTAAIQACWNYSGAHKTVCQMTRKYFVNSISLNVPSHANIQGSSAEQTAIACGPNVVNPNSSPAYSRDCVTEATGPVQFVRIDNIQIYGVEANIAPPSTSAQAQNGLHLDAEGSSGNPTGGAWNWTLAGGEIFGFWGHSLWLDASEGSYCSGTCVNQFLTFNNWNVEAPFGNGTWSQPSDAHLLYSEGQQDQFTFINGEFDGVMNGFTTNQDVYAISGTVFKFEGTTFQWANVGWYMTGNATGGAASVVCDNCWFENIGQVVSVNSSFNANIAVHHSHLANSCRNAMSTGFCVATNVATVVDFTHNELFSGAKMDNLALNNSGGSATIDTTGTTWNSGFTNYTSNLTKQLATAANINTLWGTTFFVNGDSCATPIQTVTSNLPVGGSITLQAFGGSICLASGGNIDLGGSAGQTTVQSGGVAVLTRTDTVPALKLSSCNNCSSTTPQITITGLPSAMTDAATVGYVGTNAFPGTVPLAAADGSGANGNDCEYVNQQIQIAAQGSGNNNPKVVHLYGRNYRCKSAQYKVLLPRHFGDYHNATVSSGSGIAFALNIVNGAIQSCSVSGGAGYNANGYIIGQVKDPTYIGSGGSVYAMADTNGVPIPSSCVVDSPGINYPPMNVDVVAWPQGADGATVTCSLVSGTFTSSCTSINNGTGMPQGNGYSGFSFVKPAGLTCTTYPTLTGTVGTSGTSTSALTSVTTTAGTSCTYSSSATATVPFYVLDSTGGATAQAHNTAPQTAQTIGCAIQLRAGVQIDGDGATIQPDWQTGNYGPNMIVAFCDAYGNQATNVIVRNVNIAAPAGFWLSGTSNNLLIENVTQNFASQKAQGSTYVPGSGGGLFFYAANTGQKTVIRDIVNYAPAGIIVGGEFMMRGQYGSGSYGGVDFYSGVTAATVTAGGSADGLKVSNFRQARYTSFGGGVQGNMLNAGLDTFFEQYVWHSEMSPTTVTYAPNGQGSCKSTLTPAIITTDTFLGFMCYTGISDRAVTIAPRGLYVSQGLDFQNIWQDNSYRPVISAAVTNSRFGVIQMAALGGSYTDPYLVTNTPYHGIVETSGYATVPTNRFDVVINPDTGGTHFNTSLLATYTGKLGANSNVIYGSSFSDVTNMQNTGYATLASGTVTVTNSMACSPSSTCVYSFTNCGVGGTTGAWYTTGSVASGNTFVINSVSTTGTTVTTDTSKVCWRIN